MPTTTEGAEFWVQPKRGYSEQWARNANQITAFVHCAWDDAADVKQFLVGWTEWDGVSTTLDRRTPYACPYAPSLVADSAELVEHGFKPDGSPDSDEEFDYWPLGDWCLYKVVFVRPPYTIVENEDLELNYSELESARYVSVRRGWNGRERRRPGYVFETVEATPVVIDEVGFIPDWSVRLLVTWWQIPEMALPERAISQCLARVNSAPITIRGRTYPPETLLFRGVAQDLEPYPGADGALYFDAGYMFEYRHDKAEDGVTDTYGWNGYRKNDGTFKRSRVRGSATGLSPGTPPYPGTDFGKLFIPNTAV